MSAGETTKQRIIKGAEFLLGMVIGALLIISAVGGVYFILIYAGEIYIQITRGICQ